MQRRHSYTRLVPMGSVHVTVTVEIHQVEPMHNFYDTDRPATPLDPMLPLNPINSIQAARPLAPNSQSTTTFAEAALRIVANSIHTVFTLQEPLIGQTVIPVGTAVSVICSDVNSLASLGQDLVVKEKSEEYMMAIPIEQTEPDAPAAHWMQSLELLKNVDAPLYHMLLDSLHAHTSQHILFRWNMLRKHLGQKGQVLAGLLRDAEQLSRQKWPSLVLELYFLLLDHNETIACRLAAVPVDPESLQCHLSAYCTALRIRFYLWRMTRPNPMCRLRTYKRSVKSECFRCYSKQLSSLVGQEFVRIQDPAFGQFQNVRRELVGDPVELATISKPLSGDLAEFCSICQDIHVASNCVSPLGCACIFGRDCLQPLLNRDMPSSYTCPNCRKRLHEPLDWKVVEVTTERDMRLGLLWALRSNVVSLQREIMADPEPFTLRQRIAGFIGRLVHGA